MVDLYLDHCYEICHNNHKIPPWCSSGKPTEGYKARKIPLRPGIRSHFLLKTEKTPHEDKSVQNSNCSFKGRPRRHLRNNTGKYWIYKVLVTVFLLFFVILLSVSVVKKELDKTTDQECCHRMKMLTTQLLKVEQSLRMARRKHTLLTSQNVPATLDYQDLILGASASRGEGTEEWGGRAALWGVIPLWKASPPPQTVLSTRHPTPADCWPFSGSKGEVIINLQSYTKVYAMDVEHIRPDAARSAPKHFRLFGVLENGTWIPAIDASYSYNGPAKQHYNTRLNLPKLKRVVFKIYSNHGNNKYTCVYRVRFYGKSYDSLL